MRKLGFLLVAFMPALALADDENCATMRNVPDGEISLQRVVELGLCRNPATAAAYASLQSARFEKNAAYSSYLPSVDIGGSAGVNYLNKEWGDWSYGASLSASYLIFDFGRRLSDLNQTLATYRATGFEYDETVQNYVYSLVGAYYELLNADADVKTAQSAYDVAKSARDMANKKFNAGAVAKADVLKADTTLANRDLELERAKNNREVVKGNLLTKLSFPADQNIEIMDMASTFGTDAEIKSIDELVAIAQRQRPDLLRASANKDAAWHRRNSAFLRNLPSISASASLGWNDNNFGGLFGPESDRLNGSIGIRASMPLFAGFSNLYGARAATANYERAKESERDTSNNAMLDVFTAYQNYKTAQKVLKQTKTLLASATESERVTAGMYKVGRATMLDWQTAQSELLDAQRQNNAAKYDLYVKRAAVALAIGDIKVGLEEDINATNE